MGVPGQPDIACCGILLCASTVENAERDRCRMSPGQSLVEHAPHYSNPHDLPATAHAVFPVGRWLALPDKSALLCAIMPYYGPLAQGAVTGSIGGEGYDR